MKVEDLQAVLFDLDGVLTDTASVHEQAWCRLFTEALPDGSAPYTTADYFTHIDGKPRNEGVRAVLESRGLAAPADYVDDLGNRKNAMFLAELDEHGAKVFPGAVALLNWLDHRATPKAVVSSSRNADAVLRAAGLRHLIDLVVDGNTALERGIAGKPAPDTYLYAAQCLGADPARAVVVEDATSGTRSGRAGGFHVVGVDRGAGRQALLDSGADDVVDELDEVFAEDR
jgi:beta-phosphoglucomutase family hydrolase